MEVATIFKSSIVFIGSLDLNTKLPATKHLAPDLISLEEAFMLFTPPSTSIMKFDPLSSLIFFRVSIFLYVLSINDCPPKPPDLQT